MICLSSFARSSGIVATAMQPALITPNQHAAIIGLFGPRSSTRLPGTSPRSSHEHVRDLVGADEELPVGARVLPAVDQRVDRRPVAVPRRDHPVEQLGRRS